MGVPNLLSRWPQDDGSTACGCWIYCGVYADRTRFGIFAAGIALAEDPVYTVGPQRGVAPHNAERKEPR
ncbi:hypothetical protein [Streptomyces sp. NBC_01618]|uniref:hypothetical protein n=1 Tax=Streptomyces sp. NBC_01618 TaxID=2975900 RepID=UPI0038644DF0|nr:hypothetical protein OH735_01855 [Streptomyces sp. NBC_01618]